MEATIILQVHLEAQFLGAALITADHWPDELDGFEEGHHIAQRHIPEAEPLQHLARHLGLQQLLELHLDLLGDPVPDQGGVPELPEEEEADGIEEVAGLLSGGGGRRGLLLLLLLGAGFSLGLGGARGGGSSGGGGRGRLLGRMAARRV